MASSLVGSERAETEEGRSVQVRPNVSGYAQLRLNLQRYADWGRKVDFFPNFSSRSHTGVRRAEASEAAAVTETGYISVTEVSSGNSLGYVTAQGANAGTNGSFLRAFLLDQKSHLGVLLQAFTPCRRTLAKLFK